jgi:dihydroneopterin aldolase
MMKEQSIQCVIGCNPDERHRTQELIVSVTAWVALRKSLIKNVPDFDILEKQKVRADAPDWDKWAQAELKGTHNYSSLAKISRRVCEEGKFFTIEALAECIARQVHHGMGEAGMRWR